MRKTVIRRLPTGAEPSRDGTHFRVWAPQHRGMTVILERDTNGLEEYELDRDDDGCFSGFIGGAAPGERYRLRPRGGRPLPDPVSRFQPDGPHGASVIVDPQAFTWSDDQWTGPAPERHVIYEMHIGTYTREGTWAAAAERLEYIASLGITIIEVMPVAEFPGRFNWGYDGAALFAPAHVYGTPDDMRRFVDRAHGLGLAVVLDVVYNHVAPDGCYLRDFADEYFSTRHTTEWGPALNFDERGSAHVREFVSSNAEYWIREFHLDGVRFDATQSIFDESPCHILTELTARVRAAAGARRVWIVAENEPQDVRLVREREDGGHGMDAMWNDDFHHSAMVTLTGVTEAYYSDHRGMPQEMISCARHGFLFQGQTYTWQNNARGTSTRGVPGRKFVNFIQNHDQIANSAAGLRIHELSGPGELRAMTALMLLMPGCAMLFQGQEFAASAPFLYFADHEPELAARVYAGRREFLMQFRSLARPDVQEAIADPASARTFEASQIDHDERTSGEHVLALHRDLIALSRTDAVFARQDATNLDGAVLGDHAFVLRFHDAQPDDRLLIVNTGADLHFSVQPEPLLAPPADTMWDMILSTESPRYGGRGAFHPLIDGRWLIPARAAMVLAPARNRKRDADE